MNNLLEILPGILSAMIVCRMTWAVKYVHAASLTYCETLTVCLRRNRWDYFRFRYTTGRLWVSVGTAADGHTATVPFPGEFCRVDG